MRLIAIDQGSKLCGFAILEDSMIIDSGVIRLKGKDRMARYKMLLEDLTELVCDNNLDAMAIEDVFAKRSKFNNPKITKIMGETRGIIASVGLNYGLNIIDINPSAITGYLGINTREQDKKLETRKYASQLTGVLLEDISEDQADAILIGIIGQGQLNER